MCIFPEYFKFLSNTSHTDFEVWYNAEVFSVLWKSWWFPVFVYSTVLSLVTCRPFIISCREYFCLSLPSDLIAGRKVGEMYKSPMFFYDCKRFVFHLVKFIFYLSSCMLPYIKSQWQFARRGRPLVYRWRGQRWSARHRPGLIRRWLVVVQRKLTENWLTFWVFCSTINVPVLKPRLASWNTTGITAIAYIVK